LEFRCWAISFGQGNQHYKATVIALQFHRVIALNQRLSRFFHQITASCSKFTFCKVGDGGVVSNAPLADRVASRRLGGPYKRVLELQNAPGVD
jgi:hypothetical protein